jgi:hypothetical protein
VTEILSFTQVTAATITQSKGAAECQPASLPSRIEPEASFTQGRCDRQIEPGWKLRLGAVSRPGLRPAATHRWKFIVAEIRKNAARLSKCPQGCKYLGSERAGRWQLWTARSEWRIQYAGPVRCYGRYRLARARGTERSRRMPWGVFLFGIAKFAAPMRTPTCWPIRGQTALWSSKSRPPVKATLGPAGSSTSASARRPWEVRGRS